MIVLIASLILGDVVHLKNGGKLEGKVVEREDAYVLQTEYGSITLQKSEVERIEPKEWAPKGGFKPDVKRRVSLPESYSHPFYAFKLYLPPKWKRGANVGKAHCSFYGPKDVAYIPRIDLMIERDSSELGVYVKKYKDVLEKTYPGVTFPFEEATTVLGNTAYQFSAVFRDGEIPYQILWTLIAKDDRKFVIAYSCTFAWFGRYFPRVDAAMRTLRIYAESAAPVAQKKEFEQHYNAGQESYRKQDYQGALERYRKAAALIPEYPEIHTLVGQAHVRLRNFTDAEGAYRKAIELDPADAANQYNLGVCLLQQSKYDGAIAALSKSVELSPDFEPALTNLGVAYLATDQEKKAKETLEKAAEADPESVAAHFNLGIAYEKLGDKRAAERQFKDTLSLDPSHSGARDGLERVKKK